MNDKGDPNMNNNKELNDEKNINYDEKYNLEKYADIINLPHHVSKKHKQMPIEERSAQFAPFAALTGYGDTIKKKESESDKE